MLLKHYFYPTHYLVPNIRVFAKPEFSTVNDDLYSSYLLIRFTERLAQTGNVIYARRHAARPATGGANTAAVLRAIEENPNQSVRVLARERGIISF